MACLSERRSWAGVAVAQTAPEEIVACVHKSTGNLRVVEGAGDCRSQETVLQWNRDGSAVPGPGGPKALTLDPEVI